MFISQQYNRTIEWKEKTITNKYMHCKIIKNKNVDQ